MRGDGKVSEAKSASCRNSPTTRPRPCSEQKSTWASAERLREARLESLEGMLVELEVVHLGDFQYVL